MRAARKRARGAPRRLVIVPVSFTLEEMFALKDLLGDRSTPGLHAFTHELVADWVRSLAREALRDVVAKYEVGPGWELV